jgi:hypothetical protein
LAASSLASRSLVFLGAMYLRKVLHIFNAGDDGCELFGVVGSELGSEEVNFLLLEVPGLHVT